MQAGFSGEGQRKGEQGGDQARNGHFAFKVHADRPDRERQHQRFEKCLDEFEQVAPAVADGGWSAAYAILKNYLVA